MAQRLKEEVRERIVAAARTVLLREGYRGMRLQDVAQEAGVATGNLYRYFEDKDALFAAVVPEAVGARLLRLIRTRVRELSAAGDWTTMTAANAPAAAALLAFLIEERERVLIVLAGADGSPLARVRPLAVREMTRLAHGYLARHAQRSEPVTAPATSRTNPLQTGASRTDAAHTGTVRRAVPGAGAVLGEAARTVHAAPDVPRTVLVQLFTSTLDMIVAILRGARTAADIQAGFAAFWRYQLAGLQALLAAR